MERAHSPLSGRSSTKFAGRNETRAISRCARRSASGQTPLCAVEVLRFVFSFLSLLLSTSFIRRRFSIFTMLGIHSQRQPAVPVARHDREGGQFLVLPSLADRSDRPWRE